MRFHDFFLVSIQRGRFGKDSCRDSPLADIVKKTGISEQPQFTCRQA